jgi:hypothetical protein
MSIFPTKGALPRTAARALNWLWLAVTAPWLALGCRELVRELAEPGQAGDPPNHVGMLVVVRALLPGWLACLGAMAILTIYVSFKGNRAARVRIAVWSLLALAYISLEPSRASFRSLAAFDAVDVAWLGSLAVLPIAWIISEI